MVVERIEQLHAGEGLDYRVLCERAGIAYSSFMRWRQRDIRGEEPLRQPGPSKVEPVDMDLLVKQIQVMHHRRHRTEGAGELYKEHRNEISRRDLNALVRQERDRQKKEAAARQYHIHWHVARLVWAMDDAEYRPDRQYPKSYLHNVIDLGSGYKFGPLVDVQPVCGEAVAVHLSELFSRHGAPLFIKRDNGGNLNHCKVDKLLSEALVIPLNSPPGYPQYNGSMERAQQEIKTILARHAKVPNAFLAIQAEVDIQELNHQPRAELNHQTPCNLFTSGRAYAKSFTRRKRKEVYDTIQDKTLELIRTGDYKADVAWRRAVREWLTAHRFITVTKGVKV